jgi:hypothetical protein
MMYSIYQQQQQKSLVQSSWGRLDMKPNFKFEI